MTEPTPEEKKAALEKILTDLQATIDIENERLAKLRKDHSGAMDAITGDARAARDLIAADVEALKIQKSELEATVTGALAEVNAGKLAIAAQSEGLRAAHVQLEKDLADLDVAKRQNEATAAAQKAEQERLDAKLKEVEEAYGRARAAESEAKHLKDSRTILFETAQAFHDEAELLKADADKDARRVMEEAERMKVDAQAKLDTAVAEREAAQKMKAEYEEKLAASQTWANDNSLVSAKLQTWEIALRATDRRIKEERAKLDIAIKEFAKTQQGGS